ncbi:NLRC3 [Symbiodinium natans]|uniref:NLRC3 protein n=1 Tax=Symbiodinium natans TaxID=878477 RepID=A0A812UQP0_9DINO|nr:NLRC3 [Symbiodinium natans]
MQAIAEGLADHKNLRDLSLGKNGFGDALAAGLGGHAALKALMLYGNRIGDGGIKAWHGASCARMVCWKGGIKAWHGASCARMVCWKALARALRPHAKLSDLRVFSNSITDVGLQVSMLSKRAWKAESSSWGGRVAMLNCSPVESLVMEWNVLARLILVLGTAQYLGLRDNSFGDDGAQALAGVLPRLLQLTGLTLSQNRVSDAGAEALVHGLRDNRVLKTLWLHENSLSDAGVEAVAAAFRDRTMEDLKLRPQR